MTTTFAFARDLDDEPQPVTLDDAYAAIRGVVEENKRLRAEVKELRAGPAGTIAEAIDLIRDQARDSEGVIDTVLRLIEGQSEPAPLTPERAAILDDAAEATARILAAIEGQARDGESPDQTVERLIRERDFAESQRQLFVSASNIDGELLDEIRAALGAPDGTDVTDHARAVAADLRRTEHDLARLMVLVRADGCEWEDVQTLCDEIEERGAPGWLERALSDETAEPVRQERAMWEARVSEAVQEGERRIDALARERDEARQLAEGALDAQARLEREKWTFERDSRDAAEARASAMHRRAQRAEGKVARLERKLATHDAEIDRAQKAEADAVADLDMFLATTRDAIPAICAGINALGSSEEDVRQRNAARDSLHALEAAVDGAEPAAVLSAAEVEALAGVAMAAEWAAHCDCEGGACRRDLRNQVQRWISAGRPLASEGKEG